MTGKVWLVGAGPGDPGLITVRGREVLERAELVLHDALVHPALLEACASAELHFVGKRFGRDSPAQEAINAQLIALARTGKRVVRLKGGDPLLFARGAEEALALARAGIVFEIVPGLSSPVAVSAYAGIPLTHRDLSSSVTFITGSDREGKEWSDAAWKKLATASETICILMGMRRIEQITAALIDGGRAESTPAAVIQWGARPEQRVVAATLGTIAARVREAGVTNPAVIIVGEVVNLRSEVSWYDRQPLFGKRILVLRPSGQAALTAAEIRRRGAEPIVFPVIELIDPPDPTPAERALERLDSYDWVLFTSANGVDRFFALLARRGRDARALARARVGVIGPKTAEAVERHAIRPDLVADEFVAERLARAILEHEHVTRVLLARALVARDVLPETLRQAGIEVDIAPVYATRTAGPERAAELNERFEKGSVDIVIFTASSTVTALVSMLDDRARQLLGSLTLAAIGPVTAATLAEQGLPVTVSAESYTIYGLLDALERYFSCSVPSASRR